MATWQPELLYFRGELCACAYHRREYKITQPIKENVTRKIDGELNYFSDVVILLKSNNWSIPNKKKREREREENSITKKGRESTLTCSKIHRLSNVSNVRSSILRKKIEIRFPFSLPPPSPTLARVASTLINRSPRNSCETLLAYNVARILR